jgi:protein XagA
MIERQDHSPTGKRYLAAGVALALSSTPAMAGAWLVETGRGQIIFSTSLTDAKQRFDRKSKPRRTDRFSKQEGLTSIDYGLHERLTVTGALGTRRAVFSIDDGPAQVSHVSGAAGLRALLWQGSGAILSAQGTVTGRSERIVPSGPRRMEPRTEMDLRLLGGYGFAVAQMTGFAEVQTGYRWNGSGRPAEWRMDATLGLRPIPAVLLLIQSFNTMAMTRDSRFQMPAPRQHKLQLGGVVDITERMSVQFGVFASVYGRESLKERGAMMAVWRKF